jgi:hypothetical protein
MQARSAVGVGQAWTAIQLPFQEFDVGVGALTGAVFIGQGGNQSLTREPRNAVAQGQGNLFQQWPTVTGDHVVQSCSWCRRTSAAAAIAPIRHGHLHEAIDVLAAAPPTRNNALLVARLARYSHVNLTAP